MSFKEKLRTEIADWLQHLDYEELKEMNALMDTFKAKGRLNRPLCWEEILNAS